MSTDVPELDKALEFVAQALTRCEPTQVAELFVHQDQALTIDYDPTSGRVHETSGQGLRAAARVWRDGRCGLASALVHTAEHLEAVLAEAAERSRLGQARALPLRRDTTSPPSRPPGDLSSARAIERCTALSTSLGLPANRVQAVQLKQFNSYTIIANTLGGQVAYWMPSEQALIRAVLPRGLVVDAIAEPYLDGRWHTEPLAQRVAEARAALGGVGVAADRRLPVVLRPAVASALVAGLGWLLRGDTVLVTPGLERGIGKKLFPAAITAADDPRQPEGMNWRTVDDEGQPCASLVLIERGYLRTFLHSTDSAERLGGAPNGRALRFRPAEQPLTWPLNFHLKPGTGELPDSYLELTTRLETQTLMPYPGTILLLVGGWEVRQGQRARRLEPFSLELLLLPTLRQVQAMGDDLLFVPMADGCGTPSLVLPPLEQLGGTA